MGPQQYTNFYKRALLRGCMHNLQPTEDLALVPVRPEQPSVYITERFDTKDPDSALGLLKIAGEFLNLRLEVIVAVADSPDIAVKKDITLDQFLADPQADPAHKAQVIASLSHMRFTEGTEFPLYALKGRYVWIYLATLPAAGSLCRLNGIRLTFPKASFADYFPEFYRENSFFERYIAVFQTLYLNLEQRVDKLPNQLDYENTEEKYLSALARWLGLGELVELFSGDRLREVIRRLDLFQAGKGTHAALAAALELETGKRPRIVERFQWSELPISEERRRQMDRLYGIHSDSFCVIVENLQESQADIARLERLIRYYSPIGTTHQLVSLRQASHMDIHCYLDINSALTTPKTARVGGVMLDSHITAG